MFVEYKIILNRYFKLILFSVFIGVVFQYYFINRPGKISQTGDQYANFKSIGEYIYKNAENSEVVVLSGVDDLPNPQIVYYSKRNFRSINHLDQLKHILSIDSIFFCQIKNDRIVRSKHLIINQ